MVDAPVMDDDEELTYPPTVAAAGLAVEDDDPGIGGGNIRSDDPLLSFKISSTLRPPCAPGGDPPDPGGPVKKLRGRDADIPITGLPALEGPLLALGVRDAYAVLYGWCPWCDEAE